ncbi:hypothetical protein [Bacteriovorax sp. Seq25_V]|uniref:hypothetical protein n=1 Tax=Bacteriovorax sp. Seq25_V TaxID=1201288 RepID=UPI000389F328|nr:hypothetical protein [Bacteriovorax sp. Seq25_V]EQC46560.1 hypothetical protein M900_2376 [Bacteriovorax sp. Seq25_V]
MVFKSKKLPKNKAQLEFEFPLAKEQDRNFHLGGKSFYFFDFDDNVVFLSTPIVIFHKDTGSEKLLSSHEFAKNNKIIGKEGVYKDFYMDFCDDKGSFRNFRDQDFSIAQRLTGKRQSFISDIQHALNCHDHQWKAPSWNHFYHATYNNRPVSIITARGHREDTIKEGIELIVKEGHLPNTPNFHTIYAVSNPETRKKLGATNDNYNVPELKYKAIIESVERAIEVYGYNDHHRFGMSDDDANNIDLITDAMVFLKKKYAQMSFYVIQTYDNGFEKREVLENEIKTVFSKDESQLSQLNLFAQ